MAMKPSIRSFIGMLLSLVTLLLGGEALAAEFSAQVLTRYQGEETRGKVYVKDNRIRQEFSSGRGAKIIIYNADTKLAWMIMPERQMYLEMPITEEITRSLMQAAKDQGQMNPLGVETVNGYSTNKYETAFRLNGGELRHHIWVAKKLGLIIKVESLDKTFSREYQEIKEGEVPEAMFAPPADYQKMDLPGGMPAIK
jgi:hypothetical protein